MAHRICLLAAALLATLGAGAARADAAAGDPEHRALYAAPPPQAAQSAPLALPREAKRAEPSAPGWSVDVERLGDGHYRFHFTQFGLHAGGEGEVRRMLERHAAEIVREGGFAGYEILRLEEGVRSGWLFGSRIGFAVIRAYRVATWPAL